MDRLELITFQIAEQFFGIEITSIREIRAWSPLTRLPNVPDYVNGVVNLRGVVLPVIDLSIRIGWSATQATPRNPIIVTEHERQSRGLIVHHVSDIVSIDADTMQQPDKGFADTVTHFLKGVAPLDEQMIMVLDLGRLLSDQPMELAA